MAETVITKLTTWHFFLPNGNVMKSQELLMLSDCLFPFNTTKAVHLL